MSALHRVWRASLVCWDFSRLRYKMYLCAWVLESLGASAGGPDVPEVKGRTCLYWDADKGSWATWCWFWSVLSLLYFFFFFAPEVLTAPSHRSGIPHLCGPLPVTCLEPCWALWVRAKEQARRATPCSFPSATWSLGREWTVKVTGEASQKGGESTPRCLPVTCQAVPFVCYCPAHGKEQKLLREIKMGWIKIMNQTVGAQLSGDWGDGRGGGDSRYLTRVSES